MSHLNGKNILSDIQYGFRGNFSCEAQLLITVNDFAQGLNDAKHPAQLQQSL